jgi:very-short-patch-repair endonuclease
VTGIWHQLNDLNIKFITQQYVSQPNGFALTDMFFPQINFHIEIDEPHHKHSIENDLTRETDIIDAAFGKGLSRTGKCRF